MSGLRVSCGEGASGGVCQACFDAVPLSEDVCCARYPDSVAEVGQLVLQHQGGEMDPVHFVLQSFVEDSAAEHQFLHALRGEEAEEVF